MSQTAEFDNLFSGFTESLLGSFVADVENPAFGRVVIDDRNEMSGQRKKHRTIYPPNDEMRILQARVLKWLRSLELPLDYSTGGQPGNSPLANVQHHRQNRYFYLTDLKGAFENLLAERVADALAQVEPLMASSEDTVEAFLWRYCCTKHGGLATGSPSSTLLFNLTLGVTLDGQLGAYCEERCIIYTRYIDDLTFSSQQPIIDVNRREIRKMILAAGLTINHQKSQVLDLAKKPITINGIGLELGGRIFVPGPYRRKLYGLLLRAWHHNDVDPDEIYGRMGAVKACLGIESWLRYTRSEVRLMRLYTRWRERDRYRIKYGRPRVVAKT